MNTFISTYQSDFDQRISKNKQKKHIQQYSTYESTFQSDRLNDKNIFQDNEQDNRIDFQKIEQMILKEQIRKIQSNNISKQYPPLLMKMKNISQKYINLLGQFNNKKLKNQKEMEKLQEEIDYLQQQKEKLLHNQLFMLQENSIKNQFEKQLYLGYLDHFQNKIKELNEQNLILSEQKRLYLVQKAKYEVEIQTQKQLIKKITKQKQKILEQINHSKNCQIDPMFLLHQKLLKSYHQKVQLFQNQYLKKNPEKFLSGLITKDCQKYDELTKKQFKNLINNQTDLQNVWCQRFQKNQKLQNAEQSLNDLISKKTSTDLLLSLQTMKRKSLQDEVLQKQLIYYKYEQLFDKFENQPEFHQPYENYDQNNFNVDNIKQLQNNIYSIKQIDQKVQKQKQYKRLLQQKLGQLLGKLNDMKQINQNLSRMLNKASAQKNLITKRLTYQNTFMKQTLQEKGKKYGIKNDQPTQRKYTNSRINEIHTEKLALFTQRSHNIQHYHKNDQVKINKQHEVGTLTHRSRVSEYKNQSTELNQLRNRLRNRFQKQSNYNL